MLIYLVKNTRPDIKYAVHQCARFQTNPRQPHYNAVRRIGRYLLAKIDEGIIFKPNGNLSKVECYINADFAGNYDKDHNEDPACVNSRSRCVMHYANSPVMWFSRLQTEIALSTTEAEYITLSTGAREVLPIRALLQEISPILNCPNHTWSLNAHFLKIIKVLKN